MAERVVDLKGLKCPAEIVELMRRGKEFSPKDVVTVIADCPTFERDLKKFIERTNRKLISFEQVDEKTQKAVIEW